VAASTMSAVIAYFTKGIRFLHCIGRLAVGFS